MLRLSPACERQLQLVAERPHKHYGCLAPQHCALPQIPGEVPEGFSDLQHLPHDLPLWALPIAGISSLEEAQKVPLDGLVQPFIRRS